MNNVKFIFSHAVISLGSYHISIMDLKKVIDPVLRPFKIKAAKGFDTVIIDPGHGGKILVPSIRWGPRPVTI
jgi:hypothetical protein